MQSVPSLSQLCIDKLAQNLIKYGPKKVRLASLSALPCGALEDLLEILVAKNALNDNVLLHALTPQTRKLGIEAAAQLRRSVLNTIGRSCPNLCILDVRQCQQVDNRIVRDVLQYCERLEVLRLDGCTRISDTAFSPALWKPPLAGLLGLRELSVAKCGQITAEGLMCYVLKGAPYLKNIGLAFCKLAVSDEMASELLFHFGLEAVDFSFCTQISDSAFKESRRSALRELRLSSTNIGDSAVQDVAQQNPQLEVFDAGWAVKLTDLGILALVEHCNKLRTLCICNTQITDASFTAIMRCRHLECLDASWCLRASVRALDILSDRTVDHRPPIRWLQLDHLGAMGLCNERDSVGLLSLPPASPGLGRQSSAATLSPHPPNWLPMRLPSEPPPMLLPPPAEPLPAPGGMHSDCSPQYQQVADAGLGGFLEPPATLTRLSRSLSCPLPLLKNVVTAYGSTLEHLLLDGVKGIADAAAIEAIASGCPCLEHLALTLGADDNDTALKAALSSAGVKCPRLVMLHIDASLRSHRVVVECLAPPLFGRLNSLTLWCSSKGGGLHDAELEMILAGRTKLHSLVLRNCEGLSEGLFPRWCNRGEHHDERAAMQQLDEVLLSSLNASFGSGKLAVQRTSDSGQEPSQGKRRRQHLRSPAAVALRSITNCSLAGAASLSDRSCEALAELLHDAQTVDLRGCPLLTEDTLRSFRKGCRFIRSVCVVMRERTLTWTALTSSVKKHRHRRRSSFASGSSGTESN
eukprot:TRINITY_DN30141_c0_g1_i1.p1 TRINITY_DN30141_c0_g1~~TRINITY_DN30141_c0_g1_i1.p1  ORF type:complete len:750 (+),score=124.23 TRINITY_DN30141_c0_g1_i1:94-2343(+)